MTDERAEQSSAGIAEQGQREGVEVGHAASGARRAADAARAPDPVAVTSAISIIRPAPPAPQVAHGAVASGLARGWRGGYSDLTAL